MLVRGLPQTRNARCAVPERRHGSPRPVACRAKVSERVQLGDSDLSVSACCLGTMTFGRQNTEAEAHSQLSMAVESGINFIDTAETYPVPPAGDTKFVTHQYLSTWLRNQRRDSLVLATKVAGYSEPNSWLRDPPTTARVSKKQIHESINSSLRTLQTDYVDLLQIHWPDRYVPLFGAPLYNPANERPDAVPIEEQLEALQELVQAGKVRYIGVSNETSYGVSAFVHKAQQAGLPKIATIQNCYNLLVRTLYETDLAETCHRHWVSLLAYSPLAGGALTGKYLQGNAPASARFNRFTGYMARYRQPLAMEATQQYADVARKYGLTLTQLSLAWCRSRWCVASTIIGATSDEQLRENLAAFEADLPPECMQDIEAVHKRYRDPAFI